MNGIVEECADIAGPVNRAMVELRALIDEYLGHERAD